MRSSFKDIQAEKTRAQGLDPDQGLQFVPEVTVTSSDDIAVTAEADIVVVTAGAKQPRQTARQSRTRSNAEETASTGPVTRPGLRALAATGARRRVDGRDLSPAGGPSCRANHSNSATQTHPA
jgi:hypothetical protein